MRSNLLSTNRNMNLFGGAALPRRLGQGNLSGLAYVPFRGGGLGDIFERGWNFVKATAQKFNPVEVFKNIADVIAEPDWGKKGQKIVEGLKALPWEELTKEAKKEEIATQNVSSRPIEPPKEMSKRQQKKARREASKTATQATEEIHEGLAEMGLGAYIPSRTGGKLAQGKLDSIRRELDKIPIKQ